MMDISHTSLQYGDSRVGHALFLRLIPRRILLPQVDQKQMTVVCPGGANVGSKWQNLCLLAFWY
jgi:hypothetical protein